MLVLSNLRPILLGSLLLGFALIFGCSDAGNQNDDGSQVAVASVIGLGAEQTGGVFMTRSGSEVILTAKDSDSSAAPLFEFQWRQIVGPGDPVVELFERNNTNRSFTAPAMDGTLEFELTVINVNGRAATDRVRVQVLPIADTDAYLRDPSVLEFLQLFVTSEMPGAVTSSTSYSLTVTPVVYWTGRDGGDRMQSLDNILDASGELEMGFVAPVDPLDPANDRFQVAVPLLDADEINKFFQGPDRGGRLEPEEIVNARVELIVSLTDLVGAANPRVFAARTARAPAPGPFEKIDGSRLTFVPNVMPPPAPPAPLPNEEILGVGRLTTSLDAGKVRQQLEIESAPSASNYYTCIDPLGQASTLDDWLQQAGFLDAANADSIVNAKYLNNYDLGFGRDMFLRKDNDGNIFTYVVNYPSLEGLVNGQGEFATVVMEYSAAPTGNCGSGTFSPTEKIVKFYAYAPNSLTGTMERTLSQNFDGRGERFLPGVCTACHDGTLADIDAFAALDPSGMQTVTPGMIPAINADLDATFMPWDVDSMLYARAADASLVDPSFNTSGFSNAQLDSVSLETQQEAFRLLNEATLSTYVANAATLARFEAPLRLVHGWYGNDDITPEIAAAVDNDPVLSTLPAVDFDGSFVQPGWIGEEQLYRDVFARYCRMCHVQQDDLTKNFDTYLEFINSANLESFIFDSGVMPSSRLTADRFWIDFEGDTSAAELTRQHLLGLMPPRDVADRTPGQPRAVARVVNPAMTFDDPMLFEISDDDAMTGALDPTPVNLDGSGSLFADEFFWTVLTNGAGCPGSVNLVGERSPQASFLVDTSPCEFQVGLEIRSGLTTSNTAITLTSNRFPRSESFTAPIAGSGYFPGASFLDVDLLGRAAIGPFGDPPLMIDSQDMRVVVDNNLGLARIGFPPLAGLSDTFAYDVIDGNGDQASANVTVNVPPIDVMLGLSGPVVGNTAMFNWTFPLGFQADSYTLQREGPLRDNIFTPVAGCNPAPASCSDAMMSDCDCTDSSLVSGSTYRYQIETALGMDSSISNIISVSSLAIPQSVSAIQVGGQIDLTWMQGGMVAPDSYRVYRRNLDVSPGTETLIASGLLTASFSDMSIEQNTRYQYNVTQLDALANESGRSADVLRTTNVEGPVGASAIPMAMTTDTLTISWQDPASGVLPTYRIERATNPGGPFTDITGSVTLMGTAPNNTFNDSGLASDTEFTYRITSLGQSGIAGVDVTTRTNVSFGVDLLPSNVSGFGYGAPCVGCHTSAEYEFHMRNNTLGCVTDDLIMDDCPTNSVQMLGVTLTEAMRQRFIRWNAGGELP